MSGLTLDEVEAIAREAHAHEVDVTGRPYLEHVQAVVDGVRERGGSNEQIAAAWLHDTLENDVLTRDWLDSAELPQPVKDLVDAMTKRPGESEEFYSRRILTTKGALLIKDADLAHNADPNRLALLDERTRNELSDKYTALRQMLGLTAG
ncbi:MULTISPECIES: HD domain-containing protein [unclassified Streptomyces]|uniref:HD domain-containing protein n=1 Tax=unclassified Streptomyces TaxID=2593676 RepID=UPI0028C4F316|nr:HD domain-containing protein [Streptomyces sp. AM8-1-1]WNO70221.1 HD domain-containing protein [Streptomyces sp. AM8-1-1]